MQLRCCGNLCLPGAPVWCCRRREESKLKDHKQNIQVWGSETAEVELDDEKVRRGAGSVPENMFVWA